MKVVVITHIVSPYQVELFNTIASTYSVDLKVVYLRQTSPERLWTAESPQHTAYYLDDKDIYLNEIKTLICKADLVIFNYYADILARQMLKLRAASKKPWCFWGERPGYHNPGWLGRLFRQWALADLHASEAPIWGIGQFAVQGYQREFGTRHPYCNLPYFSNLDRFHGQQKSNSERVFLFSGSLIPRKGVDLLARAFTRLLGDFPNVRLKLMGEGKLQQSLKEQLHVVRDHIEFLGFKDWSELPGHYHTADVLCVPSRYDGWGLVVPEGLAAGLPVIGTRQMGAALEFIKTGHNGWLIPSGDEAALLEALREAAGLSNENLAQMSSTARQSVSEHSLSNGALRFFSAASSAYENWPE